MEPIAVTAALLRAQLPDLPLREGATLMARVASRGEQNAVIVLAGVPLTAQVPPEVQAGATLRLKVQEVTPERITLQIDPGSQGEAAPHGTAQPPATPRPVPPQAPGGYVPPPPSAPPPPGAAPGEPLPAGAPARGAVPGEPLPHGAPPPPAGPDAAPVDVRHHGTPAEVLSRAAAPVAGAPHGHTPAHEAAPPAAGQPAAIPPAALAGQPPAPAALPPAEVKVEEAPARRRGADGQAADVVTLAFTSPTLGRLDLRLELRGEHLLADVTTEPGVPYAVANGASERLRARLTEAGLEPTVKVQPRHRPFDVYA